MFYKFNEKTPEEQRRWLVEMTDLAAMRPWDSGGGIFVSRYDFKDGSYCLLTNEWESEDLNSLRKEAVYGKYAANGEQEFSFDVELIHGTYSFDELSEAAKKAAAYAYLAGWWESIACGYRDSDEEDADLDWAYDILCGGEDLYTDEGALVGDENFAESMKVEEEWWADKESAAIKL